MGWRNVGIQEIRAYSNIPDTSKVTDIRQVTELTVAKDGQSLVLPTLPGKVSLIGSNKQGVIDLQNHIYKPLTDQRVKVMVEQIKDSHTFTKEFEVVIKGLHQDEGVGIKPKVAPAVQQWYGKEGQSSITSDTVLATGDSGFEQAATFYQSDLASRGLELATGDKQAQKRIEFKKVENKGYGKEGYGITIQDGVITIEAATNTGAFYATRTLLQMGESNLRNGEIRDFPSFSHRGFMLDTGRKFIPYDTLVDIMLNMAYYKMNDLQLHLNDNYIFLKEHLAGKNLTQEEELKYVLEHAKTGFRVETDVVGKNGSGKTTLTTMLAKRYGWKPRFESVDYNPYLEDYYQDIKRWSFPMEVFFLKERFKDLLEISRSDESVVQDRSIYEGVYVFTENNYAMGNLDDRDYETYMELFEDMTDAVQFPDLMIYLRASVSHLVSNIEKRGREYEQKMPLDYLENLNKRYEEFIKEKYKGRVLTIDVDNLDYQHRPKDFGFITDKIDRELFGLF